MTRNGPDNLPGIWRIHVLTLGFFAFAALVIFRLFNWQVLNSDSLTALAKSQQQRETSLNAHRGSILASDGFPLAATSQAWLLWASIKDLEDKNIAAILAPYLVEEPIYEASISGTSHSSNSGLVGQVESAKTKKELTEIEEERIKIQLSRTDVVWVPIKHKVNKETREIIEQMKIKGLGFDIEESRSYPEASMAAQVLGFVGKDAAGQQKGYFGLEGIYDLTLSGSKGVKSGEKDAFGNPIILGENHKVGALDGITLKTHLDRAAQFIVEKHLKDGVDKYEADAASVVVMRPQDGAIIAMSGYPAFDPAKFNNFDKEFYTNPAVSESFEPGSIFKPLVMAAALDAGVVDVDTKCDDCEDARIIAEYKIESGSGKYYPDSTPQDIIEHSDNVGMIWVAERLGEEKFIEYLKNFGLGQSTEIDLQGENVPSLREADDWGLIDLATASFGQGVAVTPIQMVRAVGVLANNGRMMTPQVVDRIIGQGWEEDIKPKNAGQVISAKAAKQITDIMVFGVESKSNMWPIPEGFSVAGKTGTAQIPVSGHYDANKVVSSFVGYAPANNPKFVMIVSLKDPKVGQFASQNAAFVWFNIAGDLLAHLGAKP